LFRLLGDFHIQFSKAVFCLIYNNYVSVTTLETGYEQNLNSPKLHETGGVYKGSMANKEIRIMWRTTHNEIRED